MRFLNWLYDKWVDITNPSWRGPSARRGARLLEKGTQSRGHITGIRVRYSGDADSSSTRYEYAVEVTPSAGERFRAGVRQNLTHGDRVRLGMEVLVRHDDRGRAIIDWPAMLHSWGLDSTGAHAQGGQPLRKPPEDGIDDKTLRKLKGERTDATLIDATRADLFGVETDNWDLALRIGGRDVLAKREYVPIYARHLLEPGVTLPVAVDGDRVRVDWPSAVEAQPGSASPPAPAAAEPEPVEAVAAGPAVAPEQAIASAPVGDKIEGVDFDMWVAVEAGLVRDRVAPAAYDEYAQSHGVPPGRWAAAQSAWQGRMMSDWTVGARYGEAYAAALKRKRR